MITQQQNIVIIIVVMILLAPACTHINIRVREARDQIAVTGVCAARREQWCTPSGPWVLDIYECKRICVYSRKINDISEGVDGNNK